MFRDVSCQMCWHIGCPICLPGLLLEYLSDLCPMPLHIASSTYDECCHHGCSLIWNWCRCRHMDIYLDNCTFVFCCRSFRPICCPTCCQNNCPVCWWCCRLLFQDLLPEMLPDFPIDCNVWPDLHYQSCFHILRRPSQILAHGKNQDQTKPSPRNP